MKSKVACKEITARKTLHLGQLPLFIVLGHKGLEKSQPTPTNVWGKQQSFNISKDILGVSISQPYWASFADVESIEFTYENK